MKSFSFLDGRVGLLERIVSCVRVFALLLAAVLIVRANIARGDSAAVATTGISSSGDSLSTAGGASAAIKVTRDARGRKVQYVDFSEAVIEGKARAPEGFVIQSRASGRFNSLIELRSNFRENMDLHALEGATLPPASE
jgi:hypothetical protein